MSEPAPSQQSQQGEEEFEACGPLLVSKLQVGSSTLPRCPSYNLHPGIRHYTARY